MGIEKMLRMYLLQIWSNLSDWERYIKHRKSSIRSKVEHALFACANLYSLAIAGRKLSTT